MKTPDDIKRGIITCMELNMEHFMPGATQKALADALALIQQLQDDNAEKDARIQQLELDNQQLAGMLTHMNQLRDAAAGRALQMEERVHQLEAERDAALADFKLYRERNINGECGVYACDLCKLGGKYEEWEDIKCPKGCMGIENWEWRGVQKEG